jgi:hypothetical protein
VGVNRRSRARPSFFCRKHSSGSSKHFSSSAAVPSALLHSARAELSNSPVAELSNSIGAEPAAESAAENPVAKVKPKARRPPPWFKSKSQGTNVKKLDCDSAGGHTDQCQHDRHESDLLNSIGADKKNHVDSDRITDQKYVDSVDLLQKKRNGLTFQNHSVTASDSESFWEKLKRIGVAPRYTCSGEAKWVDEFENWKEWKINTWPAEKEWKYSDSVCGTKLNPQGII